MNHDAPASSVRQNVTARDRLNALKFTFEGTISLKLRAVDEYFEFAVADTGSGIPAKDLPHVFERFHRVEGTRARTNEGSGIGLALPQPAAASRI